MKKIILLITAKDECAVECIKEDIIQSDLIESVEVFEYIL